MFSTWVGMDRNIWAVRASTRVSVDPSVSVGCGYECKCMCKCGRDLECECECNRKCKCNISVSMSVRVSERVTVTGAWRVVLGEVCQRDLKKKSRVKEHNHMNNGENKRANEQRACVETAMSVMNMNMCALPLMPGGFQLV